MFSGLDRKQKEAVGLLSIGTFLEYFDLMLYVHMAVLLNELFFPKTDLHTSQLLLAFTFCSTFVFRPLGALIFGYIGDNFGRKLTVVLTTMIMAVSCFIMATLPSYAEIGIIASYAVIVCRVLQGMSSMGEITGAFIYVTESINRPTQYCVTAFLAFLAGLGGFVALGMIKLVIFLGLDWRMAFWVGVLIALVGFVGRTSLRETADFINAKQNLQKISEKVDLNAEKLLNKLTKHRADMKTFLAAFFIECPWPVCFYIAFFYFGEILKNKFGYTSEQLINHNFIISFAEVVGIFPLIILAKYFNPLSILKSRLVIFSLLLVCSTVMLNNLKNDFEITLIQILIMFFVIDTTPAKSIIISHFHPLNRFRAIGLAYSFSRMLMYVVVSFGLIHLEKYCGTLSVIYVMVITLIGYTFALLHFGKLEKEYENSLPDEKFLAGTIHLN